MNTISVRFGVKGIIPFMPNACVIKFKIKSKDFQGIASAVNMLKGVLAAAGQGDLADKLFVEMV